MPLQVFLAFIASLLVLTTGCSVMLYQPLGGLQSPIAIDMGQANLLGSHITTKCSIVNHSKIEPAPQLCETIGRLFELQGATVTRTDDEPDTGDKKLSPQFGVEILSERIAEPESFWQNVAHYWSLTLFPTESRQIYRLQVRIFDAQGFLLREDAMLSHVTTVNGVGFYAANSLLNSLARPAADKVTTERSKEMMSRQLYGFLTQRLYDLKANAMLAAEAQKDLHPGSKQ